MEQSSACSYQDPSERGSFIPLGRTLACKHAWEIKCSQEPGRRRADVGRQGTASAQIQCRGHQTFSEKQRHQKEGERWQKAASDLRAYSVNVREALEILFRVLRRYCIDLKKKSGCDKRTQRIRKS